MIILSWNVRGLGQPLTFFHCKQLIQRYRPNFCFFMETKIDVEHGKELARKWGFKFCEGVSSVGSSGGLLILWDENVNVVINSMNKNLINAYISNQYNSFCISCLYGYLELNQRQIVWDQLTNNALSLNDDVEWIVIGDFNQPLVSKDKLSYNNTTLRGAQNSERLP